MAVTTRKMYGECPRCGDVTEFGHNGGYHFCRACKWQDDAALKALYAEAERRGLAHHQVSFDRHNRNRALALGIKVIEIRGHGSTGKPCGGLCLNGKRSCDCKCAGRCHGRGTCKC